MMYHGFHMISLSPWPLLLSAGLWNLALSGAASLHHFSKGFLVFVITVIMVISQYISWNKDVVREATFLKDHAPKVRTGLREGFLLFVASEAMLFMAIFWSFFHSSLAPAIALGSVWPPIYLEILNPYEIYLVNMLILLTSGATITLAHHGILQNKHKLASWYWHFVDVIWLFLFLTKNMGKYLIYKLSKKGPKKLNNIYLSSKINRKISQSFGETRIVTQLLVRASVQKTFSRGVKNAATKVVENVADTAAKQTAKSAANHIHTRPPLGSVGVHPLPSSNTTYGNAVNPTTNSIRRDLYKHDKTVTTTLGQRLSSQYSLPITNNTDDVLSQTVTKPVGNYPPMPHKPAFMKTRDYHQFAVSETVQTLVKKQRPISQAFYYGMIEWGNPGDNFSLFTEIFSKLAKKHGPQNIQPLFNDAQMAAIPQDRHASLKNTVYLQGYYNNLEAVTVTKVNNNFETDKVYITKEKDLANTPGYYNNSPNTKPDAVMILTPSVLDKHGKEVTHKGVDIKMTGNTTFQNQDIIQTASPNTLGESTKNANIHLSRQLAMVDPKVLSQADLEILDALNFHVNQNMENYVATNNAEAFAFQHNSLHETYKDFFCRHVIGVNLQIELSTQKDLNVSGEVGDDFRNTYEQITTDPESSLNRMVNTEEFGVQYKAKPITKLIAEYLGNI